MSKKGAYPYDYMDSFENRNKTELLTKERFHSILNDGHITDEQYIHAQNIRGKIQVEKYWVTIAICIRYLTSYY